MSGDKRCLLKKVNSPIGVAWLVFMLLSCDSRYEINICAKTRHESDAFLEGDAAAMEPDGSIVEEYVDEREESRKCTKGAFDGVIEIRNEGDLRKASGYTGADEIWVYESDVVDLDELACIKKAGTIKIFDNELLENIDGLRWIEEMETLHLYNNPRLESVPSFSNIETISRFKIIKNSNLKEIGELYSLGDQVDDITIESNELLGNLPEFNGIISIKDLNIVDNANLKAIRGFDSLKDAGDIVILNNTGLEEVSGFDSLLYCDDIDIEIHPKNMSVPHEVRIGGFNNIKFIIKYLKIYYGNSLILDAFQHLEYSNNITIVTNNEEFPELVEQTKLNDYTFSHILNLPSGLRLGNIHNLRDMSRFSHLRSIGGIYLTLPDLETLHGLEGLEAAGGTGYGVSLLGLGHVKNLHGLDSLKYIENKLWIVANPELVSLEGLDSLKSINGSIVIKYNPELVSIKGLDSVTSIDGDIIIKDNPKLPTCEAEGFVERMKELGWQGEATIVGNDDEATCDP